MIDVLNMTVVSRMRVSNGILLKPSVLNTDIDSNSLAAASLIRVVVVGGTLIASEVLVFNVTNAPRAILNSGVAIDVVIQTPLTGYGIGPYGSGIF